jgi:hypothetical protein
MENQTLANQLKNISWFPSLIDRDKIILLATLIFAIDSGGVRPTGYSRVCLALIDLMLPYLV